MNNGRKINNSRKVNKKRRNRRIKILRRLGAEVLLTLAFVAVIMFIGNRTEATEETINQIVAEVETLKDLGYTPKEIEKIVKITNKESFFVNSFKDRIIVAQHHVRDSIKNVNTIYFNE